MKGQQTNEFVLEVVHDLTKAGIVNYSAKERAFEIIVNALVDAKLAE